jgi:hypothetical protein
VVSSGSIRYHLCSERDDVKENRMARGQQRRMFEIRAEWDSEAGVWWCSNDELPLTTEAPTFEQIVLRCNQMIRPIGARPRAKVRYRAGRQ